MILKSSKQLIYAHFVNLVQGIKKEKKNFVFKKQNSTFFFMEKVIYVNKLIRKRKGERKEKKTQRKEERKKS